MPNRRTFYADTPAGPLYHRYQHDGYGEHADGSPFDGSGIGRLWPLLAGERGTYALTSGEDPLPYLQAMAGSSTRGRLLPEQVWDAEPVPERRLERGRPTGSASPLVWAHAEYLKLYASQRRAIAPDRLASVAARYAVAPTVTVAHVRHAGEVETEAPTVLIETNEPFVLHVGIDGWQQVSEIASQDGPLGVPAVEIPASLWSGAARLNWTRRFVHSGAWEGVDHIISRPTP